ncbi:LAMI_0D08350g1_1 [Lachancea mirantina]|uniref:Crh-like protein n=1 Tax=Lachancea mirantina TaxID=1230905 RepID=A0A1G4JCV7_9SACH|nr:LAMI_0D08350g1_1 [Lachancea mirantina]
MWFCSVFVLLSACLQVHASTYFCNSTQSCPESQPCCSQYGVCGAGSYCLGGCNPVFSYNLSACMPMPICKDTITIFDNYSSNIANQYTYLGDAEGNDWIYEGYVQDYSDENALILAMPKDSGGTVLSSTRYVWYGKIGTRMKTSHDVGVVTAFIMFSSVQDEIDYEFVGADLKTVQTNYYFEGILNYNHSANISSTDTYANYHLFEVDWHEDYVQWLVDGEVGRTLYKNETYNATSKQYAFPQTPSRVQISLWPAGNATNAPGTIAWSGGEINWNSADIQDNGYYYAILESANITCYDPPAGTKGNGTKAYRYYDEKDFTQGGVMITDDDTVMGSLADSGFDPDEGKSSSSSSSSSAGSSTTTSATSSTQSTAKSTGTGALKSASTSEGAAGSGPISSSKGSASSAATGFVQNINSSLAGTSSTHGSKTASSSGIGAAGPRFEGSLSAILLALLSTVFPLLY